MSKDVTWFDDVNEMRRSIGGYTRAPQPEYEPVKAEIRKPKEVVVPDKPKEPENVVVPDESNKQSQKKSSKKAEVKKEETADE